MGYKTPFHVNTQVDGGTANTDTCVVTKPTGLAVNDVMLAFFLTAIDAVTPPAGWTQYDSDDSTNMRCVVFYKVATSGDVSASTFTFTAATALGPFCGGISAYRDVDTSTPINTQGLGILNNSTNPVTTPSTTTTQPSLLVHYHSVRITSTTISTFSGPGGYSERADVGNHGASTSYSMAWYDNGAIVGAGSNSGIAVTASGSVTQSIARTIALQGAALSDGTDTSSGAEGLASIAFNRTDAGSGAETQSLAVALNSSQTASGTEAQSLVVYQTRTDTTTGTESQSVFESVAQKSGSDSASGFDDVFFISFSRSDTASSSESIHIVSVSDWSDPAQGTTSEIPFSAFLVMGPATIYVADVGSLEPALAAIGSAPDSNIWTDMGGTLGGVNLTLAQTYETPDQPVQMIDKVSSRLKKRQYIAEAALAEPTLTNIKYLLNGGTTASGVGYTNYIPPAIDKGTPLTYKAVIIDGWTTEFNNNHQHKRRRVIMRKCLSIDTVTVAFSQDKQTTLPVKWASHWVDGIVSPITVIDEL